MEIKTFFDNRTFTLTHVVFDPESKDALVIDPVLDYEPLSSTAFAESAERLITHLRHRNLQLRYVLETHAHADHLSGAQLLKQAFPAAKVAIGERIREVQQTFKGVFGLPADFATDGSQFDRLLADGERFSAGTLEIEVMSTPGHTPADVTYRIGDVLFLGDLLFMPDSGTGRCDFPGGSAKEMYASITAKIYTQPDEVRVFTCHDYQPGGRALAWVATVGEHRKSNVALHGRTTAEEFIRFREKRDASLNVPKLLFQSVQVNIDAGRLPAAEGNEVRYLRLPLNVLGPDTSVDPSRSSR